MRTLEQPGEDLERPGLRACPSTAWLCGSAQACWPDSCLPLWGYSPRVHELTGRPQDWLVHWWPLVWFCFLFSVCCLLFSTVPSSWRAAEIQAADQGNGGLDPSQSCPRLLK